MKIVKVTFLDHIEYNGIDLKDPSNIKCLLVRAVGFLIHEDDERIIISPWLTEDPHSDVYVIAKSTVIKIEELVVKNETF